MQFILKSCNYLTFIGNAPSADGICTICEMKYSKDDYTLTESEYRKIIRRMETFVRETSHRDGVQVSIVTTYALHENMFSEISPIPITMEQLFMR